jgi:dolichol-phosphate mannosyltransferase
MNEVTLQRTALVIVPTYNEAENIERLVGEILAQPAPLHVVVVDDNSPDGTGALADALAARHERVAVIHRPRKLGLGTAYIAGFRRALEHGYGYAITMDADFSHNPRYLPALLGLMRDYDVAIGSRYVAGGGSTGCSLGRILLSKGANAFAKFMLGLKTHDCTAGFRCYKAKVLRAIALETIFSNGYSFLVEMITRCERRGFRVGELPIIFDNRRLGRSKISRAEILKSVYTILRLRFSGLPWERWVASYHKRHSKAR